MRQRIRVFFLTKLKLRLTGPAGQPEYTANNPKNTMRFPIFSNALVATALLLPTCALHAAEQQPASAAATVGSPTNSTKASIKDSKPAGKKSPVAPEIKLVDINSAGKAELKTLPGIQDVEADKIIAGRPYGSKSHLTTRGILPRDAYENIKRLVIAKQAQTPAAKSTRK